MKSQKKRKELDKYGSTVTFGFQGIPHFDALAPALENMKSCTSLTRALQTVSACTSIKFLDRFDLNKVDDLFFNRVDYYMLLRDGNVADHDYYART